LNKASAGGSFGSEEETKLERTVVLLTEASTIQNLTQVQKFLTRSRPKRKVNCRENPRPDNSKLHPMGIEGQESAAEKRMNGGSEENRIFSFSNLICD
jgi:hypothetical protein